MIFRTLDINRNTALGFCAILLWSTTVALARSISEQIGPLTAGASVYLTGGIILSCNLIYRDRSVKRLIKLPRAYLFGCGALFLIYTTTLFLALGLALDRQQTLEIGLVNYLWPTLTILFSLVILSKRASFLLIPGTLVAFFGIVLVLTQGTSISWGSFSSNVLGNPVAYGLGLLAAVSWGLYSNLTRRWAGPDSIGAVPLFVMVTGLTMLLFCLLRPEEGAWNVRVVAEVTLFGLATSLTYVFWDIAMRKGDIVLVASCSYFTPLLSTMVSCIYLQVMPGISLWVGCILIIAGSFLSWRSIE